MKSNWMAVCGLLYVAYVGDCIVIMKVIIWFMCLLDAPIMSLRIIIILWKGYKHENWSAYAYVYVLYINQITTSGERACYDMLINVCEFLAWSNTNNWWKALAKLPDFEVLVC